MSLILVLLFAAVAANHCDKPCPTKEDPGCVSRDGKCYFTIPNPCVLHALNCYRKSKKLSVLEPLSRNKCGPNLVPVCDNVDTS
ncbi:uncharacterized protein Dana_GF26649 [Drosophila ananassae]|uniref:Kazal-like domain-containing protein n=1 Tax=Drosophila ananassae TaxID=7217 RepID=A0A0P8XHR9_DROAN|nr:uncharacterized protein Dana_GF26649 [Drosophila ananassae]